MIHDMIQLVFAFFEVLGSWLRHEIGMADYRIVRIVFFSTLAVWFSLELAKIVTSFVCLIRRLVTFYVPLYPEINLMLGLITQDEYDRRAYQIFRPVGKAIKRAYYDLTQRYQRRSASGDRISFVGKGTNHGTS